MHDLIKLIIDSSDLNAEQKLAMLRTAMETGRRYKLSPPVAVVEPMRTRRKRRTPRLGCLSKPRTKLHETWRTRRMEASMDQRAFALAVGIPYAVLRHLEGGYTRVNYPPKPATHAAAEAAYQRWLDARTAPAANGASR